jgi:cytolysin-activating lysine-acyltransferase
MAVERLQGLGQFEALGMMVSICVTGASYMGWNLHDLSRYFMPPITLSQYSIFVSEQRLVGFITWAFLSDQHTEALKAKFEEPEPDDWRSGQQLWFMDMVSTEGHTHDISRMLQSEILKNADSTHAFALRRRRDGTVRKVSWFPVLHDKSPSEILKA